MIGRHAEVAAASAAAVGKWATPAVLAGVASLLALDFTQVSISAIAAVQAAIVGWIGWRTTAGQARQDTRQAALQRDTEVNSVRIMGADRLIDQLQETTGADRQLIAVLQAEIAGLHAELLSMNHQNLAVEGGARRLVAQLRQHKIDPVWVPPSASDPPPT